MWRISVGSASGLTRKKPFLVVQLTAWPWIPSKLKQVAAYFKYFIITPVKSKRWHSTLRRLQKYLTTTATKERESTALARWISIALRKLALVKQSTPLHSESQNGISEDLGIKIFRGRMPFNRIRSSIVKLDKNTTLGTPLWKNAGYAHELMFFVLLLSIFFCNFFNDLHDSLLWLACLAGSQSAYTSFPGY